jgi:hypothetical protein
MSSTVMPSSRSMRAADLGAVDGDAHRLRGDGEDRLCASLASEGDEAGEGHHCGLDAVVSHSAGAVKAEAEADGLGAGEELGNAAVTLSRPRSA